MRTSFGLRTTIIVGIGLLTGILIGHRALPLTSAFNTTQNLTIAPYVTHDEVVRLIQEYDQTAVEPLRRQVESLSQGGIGRTFGGTTGTFAGTTGTFGGTTGTFGGTTGTFGGTTGTFGGGGQCGNGLCEGNERATVCPVCAPGTPPDRCECKTVCPQDCGGGGNAPRCGNGVCEAGEGRICPVCFRAPCDVQCQPGTCEVDCPAGGGTSGGGIPPGGSCPALEQQINALAQQPQTCQDDGDCTVFKRKREPFFTCGVALNRDISRNLDDAIDDFTDDCVEDRSVRDVDCPRFRDRCVQGRCVLEPR